MGPRRIARNGSSTGKAAAAAGQRSEPLAAFFFAGDTARTMDLVAGWLRESPNDERIRNTFLATGLRLQRYRRHLAQWAWRDADLAHRAERGQWLLGALEQFLNKGGKPGPDIVAELFPPEVRLRDTLWEAASNGFADRHWYLQAAQLGTRVYALVPSNRSEYALKIAQWELYLGNGGHARAVLRDAIESDRGESFETSGNSVFAALRAYFLMLPEAQRGAFVDDYLQRMRDGGEQAHATLAAVLLHGMSGDQRAAERDLDDLVSMRMLSTMTTGGTPDARRWDYVLNNGMQLQAWNLDTLAAYYWRHALKEVSAFERQDGDATNSRRKSVAACSRSMWPPPPTRNRPGNAWTNICGPGWVGKRWPTRPRNCWPPRSIRPPRGSTKRSAASGPPTPNIGAISFWPRIRARTAAVERNLDFLLSNVSTLPAGLTRIDLINRLANLREAEGDGVGACRLLEHAQRRLPARSRC